MDLKIRISGESRQAQEAIRGVSGDIRALGNEVASRSPAVKSLMEAFDSLATPAGTAGLAIVGIAAAATAAGAALGAAVADVVSYGDRVGDTAAQLGIGTDALQSLEFAATRSGAEADGLRGALRALTGSIVDAQDPASDAARIFEALGVSTTDAAGMMRPVEDVFRDLVAAMGDLPAGTERSAAAAELLGRQYQALMPLLDGGAEGLRTLEDRARELGVVMSADSVDAASALDDQLVELRGAASGLSREIGVLLVPMLTSAARAATDMLAAVRPLVADIPWGEIARGITSIIPGGGLVLAGIDAYRALSDGVEEYSEDVDDVQMDAAAYGEGLDRLAAALRAVEDQQKSTAKSTRDLAVTFGEGSGVESIAPDEVEYGNLGGVVSVEVDREAQAEARAAQRAAAQEARELAQQAADAERAAAEQAQAAWEAYRGEIMATGEAIVGVTDIASTMTEAITTGADESTKSAARLGVGMLRLAAQMIASTISTATTAQAESVATGATVNAVNATTAATGIVSGAAQATATYGASAAAGAAGFAAAVGAVGGTIAGFLGLIEGVADAGVGPDELRRAGLGRHTVLAVRNDERVLGPSSTRAVDDMLQAYRAQGAVGRGGEQRITVPVQLDGRTIAEVVAIHHARDDERGMGYRSYERGGLH